MANEKITCLRCGKEKAPKRDFYTSPSPLNVQTGRLPICKACVKKRFEELMDNYNDKKMALKHLLLNLDMYFSEQLYDEIKDEDDVVSSYITKLNSKAIYRDRTSLDNQLYNPDEQLDDEETWLIAKWGDNRNKGEYERLEALESLYMESYPSNTLQEQVIIRALCEFEVEKQKCRMNGDYSNFEKMDKRISAKMEELNIIPSKTKAYMEDSNMVAGCLINMIETEIPIPNSTEEFDDVDNIESQYEKYYLKPIRKVMNWTKSKLGGKEDGE